jgi:hypothetical protein
MSSEISKNNSNNYENKNSFPLNVHSFVPFAISQQQLYLQRQTQLDEQENNNNNTNNHSQPFRKPLNSNQNQNQNNKNKYQLRQMSSGPTGRDLNSIPPIIDSSSNDYGINLDEDLEDDYVTKKLVEINRRNNKIA